MSSYGRTVMSEGRAAGHGRRARGAGRSLASMIALVSWLSGCGVESGQTMESEESADQASAGLSGCCGVPPASPSLNGLRLSLSSGSAALSLDITSSMTAYLVPYESRTIALYDGVAWVARTMTLAASISNVSTSVNTSYDVYAYWNGTNVVLEKEATPATPTLALRDGVAVKGNDPRRRYVGVVATNGYGDFEDSAKNRLVWNRDNQLRRPINGVHLTSWSLTGNNTWRAVGGTLANRVTVVSGVSSGGAAGAPGTYLTAQAIGMCVPASSASNAYYFATGIGIDSSSINSSPIVEIATGTYPSMYAQGYAEYQGYLAPGVHTVYWLEIAQSGGSFTCIGHSPPFGRLGLNGSVLM